MSGCGCVHLHTTQHIVPLGESLLLFPLREMKRCKGGGQPPHFHALRMKGYHDDGQERADLCSARTSSRFQCQSVQLPQWSGLHTSLFADELTENFFNRLAHFLPPCACIRIE